MTEQKAAYRAVAPADVLAADGSHEVEVEGRRVLLCRSAGEWFAVQGTCSHAGQPLAGGRVGNAEIVCPHHGARFSLRTGRHLSPPAFRPIRTFAVRVREGQVEVALESREH
jgi:3-phenylpropionate/trans-cinnamate dioxygenase ferredoxin subunit